MLVWNSSSFRVLNLAQENLGGLTKTWSDFTSLNYWVVRDYYRLVKSVNALEPQIQRLSNEQVLCAMGFFLFFYFYFKFFNVHILIIWMMGFIFNYSLGLKLWISGKGCARGKHWRIFKLV